MPGILKTRVGLIWHTAASSHTDNKDRETLKHVGEFKEGLVPYPQREKVRGNGQEGSKN